MEPRAAMAVGMLRRARLETPRGVEGQPSPLPPAGPFSFPLRRQAPDRQKVFDCHH